MRRLTAFLLVTTSTSVLTACGIALRPPSPPSPADSMLAKVRMTGILQDHFSYIQAGRPEIAAWAGRGVINPPDVTQNRVKVDAQFARAALQALDGVDVRALTEDDYVSWLALRWEMEALSGWPAFYWTMLGDVTPGTSPLGLTAWVVQRQAIASPAEAFRFRSLVESVEGMVNAVRKGLTERAARGIRLPAFLIPRGVAFVRSFISPAQASPFGLPPSYAPSSDSAWQNALRDDVREAIEDRTNLALESLARFLEGEYAELAPARIGLSQYPGGAAHYAALLRFHTTLEVTPEAAHAIGLREARRAAIATVVALLDAGLPAERDTLVRVLQRDPRFAIDAGDSATIAGLPASAARLYEDVSHRLDSVFARGPASPLSISAMQSDEAEFASLTAYEPPSVPDPVARYTVNVERLRTRSLVELPALVLEDLLPGLHHLVAPQRESATLPPSRRVGWHGGLVHGWQVYAMVTADSLLNAGPLTRVAVRLRELVHACGLVVDTGINALGWTREDALAFLRTNLPWDEEELERAFIIPAAERPGELSAAALGARELRGLRRWVEQELGPRFSLTAFHREILRVGSIPLPVLGAHLERWIWEEKQRAAHPIPNPPPPTDRQR